MFVIIDHISKERMKTSGKREISADLPDDEYKALVIFLSEIQNVSFLISVIKR